MNTPQRTAPHQTSSSLMDLQTVATRLSTIRSRMKGADSVNLVHALDKLLRLANVAETKIGTTNASRSFAGELNRLNQDLLGPITANDAEIRLAPTVQNRIDALANQISEAIDGTVYINSRLFSLSSTLERDLKSVTKLLSKALDTVGVYNSMTASVAEEGGRRIVLLEDKPTKPPLHEVNDVVDNHPDNRQIIDEDILELCPKFRILVLGRSGTGKSTLINHIFSINIANESDYIAGFADINVAIKSPKNDRLILHDSQGFEQGELDNLNTVKDFITKRHAMPNLQDKLHAVWLCIQAPYAGGRLLEKGDEEFLKADFGLPVIVVFTKYDNLRLKVKKDIRRSPEFKTWSTDEATRQIENALDRSYGTMCIEPLKRLNSGKNIPSANVSIFDGKSLQSLVELTGEHVQERLSGAVDKTNLGKPANFNGEPTERRRDPLWMAWAVAQRASADLNIEASIAVGQRRYWRALACSSQFGEKPLQVCLDMIHKDIVDSWNFREPSSLCDEGFKEKVRRIVDDLTDDSILEAKKDLTYTAAMVSAVSRNVGGLSGHAARVFIPALAQGYYLTTGYNKTPPVLRVLMGYIIDLTAILEGLFNLLQSEAHSRDGTEPRPLSKEMINKTIENYEAFKDSENGAKCHADIRSFVGDSPTIFSADYCGNVSQELIRLMQTYRFRVVQEWMDGRKDPTVRD